MLTFVQSKTQSGIGNTTATLPGAVGLGDNLVLIADSILGQGTVSGITDGNGNTWTLEITFNQLAGIQLHVIQIWTATNKVASANLAILATSASGFLLLTALNYSSSVAFTFDQSGSANITASTTPSVSTSGAVTPGNQLVLCYIGLDTGGGVTFTPETPPYTERTAVLAEAFFDANYASEDEITPALAAPFVAGWTLSVARNAAIVIVTFALDKPGFPYSYAFLT